MERRRLDEPRRTAARQRVSRSRRADAARLLALSAALLASGAASASEDARREVLTLDAAVAMALAENPTVHAAEIAVERDEAAVAAARTRYFPSISTEAHAGQLLMPVELEFRKGSLGGIPGLGPLPEKDTTVRSSQDLTFGLATSLMQPLTQLYTAHQGVRLARIGREADRAQLQAERAGIVASVRRLYHQLVASRSLLEAATEQLAAQRELARITAQQIAREAALRPDELQARSAVAAAAVQVRRIENGLATGKEQLNRLLGRDLRTEFAVEDPGEPVPEPPDLDAARARALRDRPELRRARAAVEKAETERRMKLWEYVPEVSAGVSYSSTFNVETLPRHVAIAGVFARWDLDWGRRGKEAAQKSLAIEEARARARDAEAAVMVEVGDRLRKLEEARDQAAATRLAFEALRAKAPVVAARVRVEAALLRDALDVQAALAKATHDHEEALFSLWSAQADLEQALGVAP